MPSFYPAPTERDIERMLATIARVPTPVTRQHPIEPQRQPTGVIVEYVTEDDSLGAIAFADHEAVNFLGGSIAAIESATMRETSRGSRLHSAAVDTFHEVAAGLSGCLNGDYTPALRVGNTHPLPGPLSDEIKQLWRTPGGKRAYRVAVDQYGSGTVILHLN